jgi:hypothetical protein
VVRVTTHRPAPLSALLAVLAAAAAIGLVATAGSQRFALVVVIVGLAPLAAGLELWRRGHALLGALLALAGTGVVAGGIGLGYLQGGEFSAVVELLPGLAGLYLLVLGLGPVWRGRERLLFSAGTGLVFVSLLISGVVYETDGLTLLLTGVLTVVAWDFAEQAVNLGEQVGREARTYQTELVHGGATMAVGGVAIGLTRGIQGANVQGLSLLVLAGLLGAAFTLLLVLYN